ncbi:unnamed protein product [Meganyctiphanes norvegica]|uniref:C2H2-type domain-containing protein n=1 Tax=Meganyctiphanes norvegica TaxID=48144 RepID=A0AAV2RA78_MEGNR
MFIPEFHIFVHVPWTFFWTNSANSLCHGIAVHFITIFRDVTRIMTSHITFDTISHMFLVLQINLFNIWYLYLFFILFTSFHLITESIQHVSFLLQIGKFTQTKMDLILQTNYNNLQPTSLIQNFFSQCQTCWRRFSKLKEKIIHTPVSHFPEKFTDISRIRVIIRIRIFITGFSTFVVGIQSRIIKFIKA